MHIKSGQAFDGVIVAAILTLLSRLQMVLLQIIEMFEVYNLLTFLLFAVLGTTMVHLDPQVGKKLRQLFLKENLLRPSLRFWTNRASLLQIFHSTLL